MREPKDPSVLIEVRNGTAQVSTAAGESVETYIFDWDEYRQLDPDGQITRLREITSWPRLFQNIILETVNEPTGSEHGH